MSKPKHDNARLKDGITKRKEEYGTKQCAASDCKNLFLPKIAFQIYCNRNCNEREKKRKKREKLKSNGLCPQCGQKMDNPDSRHPRVKGKITYCSKCQDRFHKNYASRSFYERVEL